jgi:hypothetical protein
MEPEENTHFKIRMNRGNFQPQPGDKWRYLNSEYLHLFGEENIVYTPMISRDGAQKKVRVEGRVIHPDLKDGDLVGVSKITHPDLRSHIELKLKHLGDVEFL